MAQTSSSCTPKCVWTSTRRDRVTSQGKTRRVVEPKRRPKWRVRAVEPRREATYERPLRRSSYDYPPNFAPPGGSPPPPPEDPDENGGGDDGKKNDSLTRALVAGAFLVGIGAGVWFDTEVNFHESNVASTEIIDRKTPNSEICMANGYSSMVFDQRIYVSFNPFNVYVSQPEVKPGCVLRRSNISVLESRGLVSKGQVAGCKRDMNTFAFVGDLGKSPEVNCVYHSEEAENQFMKDPSKAALGDGNQPLPKDMRRERAKENGYTYVE